MYQDIGILMVYLNKGKIFFVRRAKLFYASFRQYIKYYVCTPRE